MEEAKMDIKMFSGPKKKKDDEDWDDDDDEDWDDDDEEDWDDEGDWDEDWED